MSGGECAAEVVHVTEELHPLELEGPQALAEFVGGAQQGEAFAVADVSGHDDYYDETYATHSGDMYAAQNGGDVMVAAVAEPDFVDGPDSVHVAQLSQSDRSHNYNDYSNDHNNSSYNNSGYNNASSSSIAAFHDDAPAEIVSISEEYHPSASTNDEAQAEFIGTDDNMHHVGGVAYAEDHQTIESQAVACAAATDDVDHDAASDGVVQIPQDAVGDSCAEVLSIDENYHPAESTEGEATAEFLGTDTATAAAHVDDYAMLDGQIESSAEAVIELPAEDTFNNDHAQVVSISEEYHPAASTEDEATAEFVRTDAAAAAHVDNVAVLDDHVGGSADGVVQLPAESTFNNDHAQVVSISEEYHPAASTEGEAQAEFIGTDGAHVESYAVLDHAQVNGDDYYVASQAEAGTATATATAAVADTNVQVQSIGVMAEYDEFGSTRSEPAIAVASTYVDQQNETTIEATTLFVEEEQHYDDGNDNYVASDDPYDVSKPPSAVAMQAVSRNQSAPASIATEATRVNREQRTTSNEASMSHDELLGAAIEEEWMGQPERPSSDRGPTIASDTAAPPIPARSTPVVSVSTNSRGSNRSDASLSASQRSVGLQNISSNIARGTNNMMGMLFGDTSSSRTTVPAGFNENAISGSILPRMLLPSSVIHNPGKKNPWVATVNTNQKALDNKNVEEGSRSLRSFALPSKKQAVCLANAWAPPRMHPFESNPKCFICESRFAVFRRACHCRNCGVCICSQCSIQWPSKMLPDTYNIKREAFVNICSACNWLCNSFRVALLDGDFDKAVALHSTGNLNLTTPFANVKGELFYPVHCAVYGGNLKLLKWLVDEHCCPLRSIRISDGREERSGMFTPILTSKGRSLLGIALSNRNIGMVQYLVVQKKMLLNAEKNLSIDVLTQNLDLVLRVLPEEVLGEQTLGRADQGYQKPPPASTTPPPTPPQNGINRGVSTSTTGTYDTSAGDISAVDHRGQTWSTNSEDDCIICFSNRIDCVVTPCGHQICCLECSNNISRCPVCSVECSFMRIFRP